MLLLPAYAPADMVADLAAGTATVLPWVGAGVGGGLVLLFAFMGIRTGFRIFQTLATEKEIARKESSYESGRYSERFN